MQDGTKLPFYRLSEWEDGEGKRHTDTVGFSACFACIKIREEQGHFRYAHRNHSTVYWKPVLFRLQTTDPNCLCRFCGRWTALALHARPLDPIAILTYGELNERLRDTDSTGVDAE